MYLIHGICLAAFVVAVVALERDDLLEVGFVLPLQVVVLTVLSLTTRRRDFIRARRVARITVAAGALFVLGYALLRSSNLGWAHFTVLGLAAVASALVFTPWTWGGARLARRSITAVYLTCAGLGLVLTGAMPAAAFFKVARSAHTEMLVKHGQLQLASDLRARQARLRKAYTKRRLDHAKERAGQLRLCEQLSRSEDCDLGLYFGAFFKTRRSAWSDSVQPRIASSSLVQGLLVPYRPQSSIELRGLVGRVADDSAWSWTIAPKTIALRVARDPAGPPLALSSTLPDLRPQTLGDFLGLLVLFGLGLPFVVWQIVRFVAHRFFLIDVTDPVVVSKRGRIISMGDPNLFVVCKDCQEAGRIRAPTGVRTFDLRDRAGPLSGDDWWRRAQLREGAPVLLKHFEHRYQEPAVAEAKLRLLNTLVHDHSCQVVAVSGQDTEGAPLGLRAAWGLAAAAPNGGQNGTAEALRSFVLVDAGRWCGAGNGKGDRRWPGARWGAQGSRVASLIAEESRCDRHLRRIWDGFEHSLDEGPSCRAEPTRGELLDLLGERAESYYEAIWESCRPAERVVLVHLAITGLVNEKDRRVLRRLLVRGLVRREPHFTVMNETFRQHLLRRRAEVEVAIPKGAGAWDSVRRPITVAGVALAGLLFVTQQDLFNAATATVLAMSTGLASIAKVVGLFGGRRSAVGGE